MKLHQVLAVEADLKTVAEKVIKEASKTFTDKVSHFLGWERVWTMFDSSKANEAPPAEHQHMDTTVAEKLDYVSTHVAAYYDNVLRKEVANQGATADVVVDGKTIMEKVPATFLLGLENKLKLLRGMYAAIPTLAPGRHWEVHTTMGQGVYIDANPERRFKTAKTFQHKVLVPAAFPKEGEGGTSLPAQIEKWEETINVGESVKTTWSGMLSPAEKSAILYRLDKLIQAVKKSRMRANDIEVEKVSVGKVILDYINKGV